MFPPLWGYESCRGKQITLKLKSGLSKIGARGRRKEEQKFLPKHLDSSEMIHSFGQQVFENLPHAKSWVRRPMQKCLLS